MRTVLSLPQLMISIRYHAMGRGSGTFNERAAGEPYCWTKITQDTPWTRESLSLIVDANSPRYKRPQVEAWEKRLAVLSETLDEWVTVQRNWMYLETIFCAEDIQKQLPEEAAKFQAVDKMWKVMMIARRQRACPVPTMIRHRFGDCGSTMVRSYNRDCDCTIRPPPSPNPHQWQRVYF